MEGSKTGTKTMSRRTTISAVQLLLEAVSELTNYPTPEIHPLPTVMFNFKHSEISKQLIQNKFN